MTARERSRRAIAWRTCSLEAMQAAQRLFVAENYRGCANRAYYAAYQAMTSVCILHGDSAQFPSGWNNPSHEQLPDLIQNNGSLSVGNRVRIRQMIRALRHVREDADYRPGVSIERSAALGCLHSAGNILELLDVMENTDE